MIDDVHRYDYHVHSDYSDGTDMELMVETATEIGLAGIGFADHCNITRGEGRTGRGSLINETYEARRSRIEELSDEYEIRIFDAVEMDYYPDDERRIRTFLSEAGFEYAIGSIHYLDGKHVSDVEYFSKFSRSERRRLLDDYFESLLALIESGLFDIVAHIDVFERYRPFRGLATMEAYEDLAEALLESDTVPEINVGRLFDSYGDTHPRKEVLEKLSDEGVRFVFGTDAHAPETLRKGVRNLREELSERGHCIDLIHG